MAIVFRSARNMNFSNLENNNNIGPGEYLEDWTKNELNKYNTCSLSIYSKPFTKHIPFNSTSQRDAFFDIKSSSPGPCAYNIMTMKKKDFQKFKDDSLNNSREKEILANNIFRPDNCEQKKGFLSSQKRFANSQKRNENKMKMFEELDSGTSKRIPGTNKMFLNNSEKRFYTNGFISKRPGDSNIVRSIPNKCEYEYIILNGKVKTSHISKEKSEENIKNKENEIGPGKYNVYPSWDTKIINWKRSVKNEEKLGSKILREIKENSSSINLNTYSEKMRSFSNNTLNNSQYNSGSLSCKKSKFLNYTNNNNSLTSLGFSKIDNKNCNYSTGNLSTSKFNYGNNSRTLNNSNQRTNSCTNINNQYATICGQLNPRNIIFHNLITRKEKMFNDKMERENSSPLNLLKDVTYNDRPGPGFYEPKAIPKKSSTFNCSFQNFGSNSPKFFEIKKEVLGPGLYFMTRNKYEKKFQNPKNLLKVKKEYGLSSCDVEKLGLYETSLRLSNIDKNIGPGEFNLAKGFIKNECSNVEEFGSKQKRFDFFEDGNLKDKEKDEDTIKSNKSDKNDKNDKNDKGNKKEKTFAQNDDRNKACQISGEPVKYGYDRKNKNYMNNAIKAINEKKVGTKSCMTNEERKFIEDREKSKRQKIMNKISPPVGTYNPGTYSSIDYQNYNKLNEHRNKLAPFNSIKSRFDYFLNDKKREGLKPGPTTYNVQNAFENLKETKRKYDVFGIGSQRPKILRDRNVPGVGVYDIDKDNWNKKSYNILFIDNK